MSVYDLFINSIRKVNAMSFDFKYCVTGQDGLRTCFAKEEGARRYAARIGMSNIERHEPDLRDVVTTFVEATRRCDLDAQQELFEQMEALV